LIARTQNSRIVKSRIDHSKSTSHGNSRNFCKFRYLVYGNSRNFCKFRYLVYGNSRNFCKFRYLVCATVALTLATSFAASSEVPGRVTDVTLYRGQALVTRTIPVEGPEGSIEIIVGGLPEEIVSGSLFAESGDDAEVRAVRFRTRAVGEEPREEVRKLDEAMEGINEKLSSNEKNQGLLEKRNAYLDKLEGFVAPTAKMELSNGVLDAESLQKVTLFSFEQRDQIAKAQAVLEKEAEELGKELALIQRKRAELTQGASRTVREAVLFLEKHGEAASAVRLSYLVTNCGWSPTYTFRAGNDRKTVALQCNALIHQMTGEDWDAVTLTLSTATPGLSAAGPGLAPFPVALSKDDQSGKLSQRDLTVQLRSIRGRQKAAIVKNRIALNLTDNIGSSWTVNSAANDFQRLELLGGKEVLSMIQWDEDGADDGPSLSYQLAGAVSLASRSDRQMVRILQANFESRFYYVATPVLTGHVYREAELKNTGNVDLLAGPITVYLDGRFVGRSEIPTVARGQTFVVGFGAEPQLRARRELADRTEGVQGGNRELSFAYRLIIENYKDEAVPVRLFDRIPHSERTADIRIKMGEMKDKLSDDKLYLRTERPKGILRWDIEVAAAAIIDKARIIEYGYTLDFDRNLSLGTVIGSEQQLQEEFEQLHRGRLKR